MTNYNLEIPDDIWEKFKEITPKSKTMNKMIMELILKEIGEEKKDV